MTKRIPLILGLVLLAISLWIQVTSLPLIHNFLTRLENLSYDLQLRTQILSYGNKFQPLVAIIDIDDKSLEQEGRWPWPREKLVALLQSLREYGAVVVAFDLIFPDQQNNIVKEVLTKLEKNNLVTPSLLINFKKIEPLFNDDEQFAEELKKIDSILGFTLLPSKEVIGVLPPAALNVESTPEKQLGFIEAQGALGNLPLLQNAAKNGGFVNLIPDEDGVIRRVPLLIRYQDKLYSSLALEAVRLYLLSNLSLVTESYNNQPRLEGIKIGNHIIPTDEKAQAIIPFRGKSFTFPYFSATDVINKKISANALQGKIIFIGASGTGVGDLRATAIQNVYPGVEIHATLADGILSDNFGYKPAWAVGAEVFLTFVLGILSILIFSYQGPWLLALFSILIPALILFINNVVWEETGLIISIYIPVILIILLAFVNMIYGYLFETRRREVLKGMFGQYVPEEHIDEMLTTAGSYALQGEDREMTVLFADIRNFTSISEPLTATQLKEFLNDFFTPMTEIIFKHQGTIDKYVGDLIMAFWGAPLRDTDHRENAIKAALEMQITVKNLQPIFAERLQTTVNIGIGINSGNMSVGDMGSKFRRNYTVLGDTVNIGSRIENLTKYYGVDIVATENTCRHLNGFLFRELDRVRVMGKTAGITIYEILCAKENSTVELIEEVKLSNDALNLYYEQQWNHAYQCFLNLSKQYPQNKFYQIYLKRIAEFKETPPPNDWNGIFTHATK